ncbi:GTP cyclohydrolase II [Chryseobacterium taklimakanense]|uniref:GTP cyclohydrolase II n=1 Tax=Chryseobacterium taklimakanense TaxID=536441 RepID=UPI001EF49FD7|nr:GTP cyclohydrolase II [Chryseobacterium taklimakanense]MCG7280484.1 GTP cyclohydrolase II [Chryseobacterium taklimakanense]
MIKKQAESNVPTDFGIFKMIAYSEDETNWMPHIALVSPKTDFSKPVNVRFHSECITGEVFHSRKCECGQQLDYAMSYINDHGGIIIYLRQEGRNIGIINKLRAYALQEKGLDTVQANLQLGLPADDRDFSVAIEILKDLGVKEVNLLTNNPDKMKYVEESGIILNSRIPLQIEATDESRDYLKVKKTYFGHLLNSNQENS